MGFNTNGSLIADSFALGNVHAAPGAAHYAGGLVGRNEWVIRNSFSIGQVIAPSPGASYRGGLVGYNNNGTVTNSFWNIETSGLESSSGGTGKTTAQMMQQSTYSGWNFSGTWNIRPGATYPLLRWPYQWPAGPAVVSGTLADGWVWSNGLSASVVGYGNAERVSVAVGANRSFYVLLFPSGETDWVLRFEDGAENLAAILIQRTLGDTNLAPGLAPGELRVPFSNYHGTGRMVYVAQMHQGHGLPFSVSADGRILLEPGLSLTVDAERFDLDHDIVASGTGSLRFNGAAVAWRNGLVLASGESGKIYIQRLETDPGVVVPVVILQGGSGGIELAGGVSMASTGLYIQSQGPVTQGGGAQGAISVRDLVLLGDGAFVLANPSNSVTGVFAANARSIHYEQTGPLTIGTVGTTSGVQVSEDVEIRLYDSGSRLNLNQDVSAGGSITLAGQIAVMSSGRTIAAGSGGQLTLGQITAGGTSDNPVLTLRAGGGIALSGGVDWSTATLTLESQGTVTQDAPIKVNGLVLLGTAAQYVLDHQGNEVAALAADTGSILYRGGSSLTIGPVGGYNGIKARGGVDVAVSGAGAVLTVPAGSSVRTTYASPVTLASGIGGMVLDGTIRGIYYNPPYEVDDTLYKIVLESAGPVTQGAASVIRANNLLLKGAGGRYTLTSDGNEVGVLAADTGSVEYRQLGALTIGLVDGQAGINATGDVRVAAVTGGTNIRLTLASGSVVRGSNVWLKGETNMLLEGTVEAVNQGKVVLETNGLVQVPGAIKAGSLLATGAGWLSLTNIVENAVSIFAANVTGSVMLYQQAPLTIGTVDGHTGVTAGSEVYLTGGSVTVEAGSHVTGGFIRLMSYSGMTLSGTVEALDGGTVILRSAGAVNGQSGAIKAGLLLLTPLSPGMGGQFTLTGAGNRIGALAGDVSSLTLSQAGTLTIDGISTGSGSARGLTAAGAVTIALTGADAKLELKENVVAGGALTLTVEEISVDGTPTLMAGGSSTLVLPRIVAHGAATLHLVAGAGGIALTGGAELAQGTLVLETPGGVTQGGAIKAAGLVLLGEGAEYVLAYDGNAVGRLAASAGSITYTQKDSLIIGTVGDQDGISAAGHVTVSVTGDGKTLTVNGTVSGESVILKSGTGGIALEGVVSAEDALTLDSPGVVAQGGNGAVTAGNLVLLGGGRFYLTSVDNNVGVLAGRVHAVRYEQTGSMAIGSVRGVEGLFADETAWVIVHGDEADLTLAKAVSAQGANDYVLVLAAGNRFLNEAGSDSIAVDGESGGYYLVFSKDHRTSDLGGLASPGNLFASNYARAGVDQAVAAIKQGHGLALGNRLVYAASPVITITIEDKERRYGEGNPKFTFTRDGLVSGDRWEDVLLVGVLTTAAESTSSVGTYAITGSGFAALHGYQLEIVDGTLTITPRPITVTADVLSKVYGEADPELTYTVTQGNLVGQDTLAGSLERVAGEDVGKYLINRGTLDNPNYEITFVDGTLQITPRPITVAADVLSKVYGEVDPALTYKVTQGNLVGQDTLAGSLERAAGENVGEYLIGRGTLNNPNYEITFVNGTLTITPRPITITADSHKKMQGDPDPRLTYRITAGNLVRGDQLQGDLSRQPGEAPGEYAILQGTLGHRNYAITFVPGTLTITLRPDVIPPAEPFPGTPGAPAGGGAGGGVGGGAAGGNEAATGAASDDAGFGAEGDAGGDSADAAGGDDGVDTADGEAEGTQDGENAGEEDEGDEDDEEKEGAHDAGAES